MKTRRVAAAALPSSPQARDEPWMLCVMDSDENANKGYIVTTPRIAYEACMGKRRVDDVVYGGHRAAEHLYELLFPDEPLRLYYDAEFDVTLNPDLDGERCKEILHQYIGKAYGEIPDRPEKRLSSTAIRTETSHRIGVKVSYHGKLRQKYAVVANMDEQRLFWGRVAALIKTDAARGDADAAMLLVNTRIKKPNAPAVVEKRLFVDMGVYTTYRLFRVLGACKFKPSDPRPAYFVPEGGTGRREDITYDIWRESLIAVHLRPGTDAMPVCLKLPAVWAQHYPLYWRSGLTVNSLEELKAQLARETQAAVDGKHVATPKKSNAVPSAEVAQLTTYQRSFMPLAELRTMWTLGGRIELSTRAFGFRSIQGGYETHKNAFAATASWETLIDLLRRKAIAVVQLGPVASFGIVPGLSVHRELFRELTFDIDLTDYDKEDAEGRRSVRTCACNGEKRACYDCWLLIELAASVLKHQLSRYLGVAEDGILWVWSGRRGLHAWVCTAALASLTFDQRVGLCQRLFEFDTGVPVRPSLTHLFEQTILPTFERIVINAPSRSGFLTRDRIEQWVQWLGNDPDRRGETPVKEENRDLKNQQQQVAVMPGLFTMGYGNGGGNADHKVPKIGGIAPGLARAWSQIGATMTGTESAPVLWNRLMTAYRAWQMQRESTACEPLYWLLGQYAFPRIDLEVTSGKNMLKSPFAVHPETKTIALPIRCPVGTTEKAWRGFSALSYSALVLDTVNDDEKAAWADGVCLLKSWVDAMT